MAAWGVATFTQPLPHHDHIPRKPNPLAPPLRGEEEAFDPETYKPEISAQVFSGYVRIKFTKSGVDGVKIYVRLKGQAVWKLLSFDTNSPYDDFIALATLGVAEVREYQAFGVIDDVQIGQPSDIANVTFGG